MRGKSIKSTETPVTTMVTKSVKNREKLSLFNIISSFHDKISCQLVHSFTSFMRLFSLFTRIYLLSISKYKFRRDVFFCALCVFISEAEFVRLYLPNIMSSTSLFAPFAISIILLTSTK